MAEPEPLLAGAPLAQRRRGGVPGVRRQAATGCGKYMYTVPGTVQPVRSFSPRACLSHQTLRDRRQLMSSKAQETQKKKYMYTVRGRMTVAWDVRAPRHASLKIPLAVVCVLAGMLAATSVIH